MTREQAIERIAKDLEIAPRWRVYIERTLDRLGIGVHTDLQTVKVVEDVIRNDFKG